MAIKTIEWKKGKIRIIDQTKLPLELKYIYCKDVNSLWQAIRKLQIRGAPALGVAAGFGVVLGVRDSKAANFRQFKTELEKVIRYLGESRPTAVNLFWALDRMRQVVRNNSKQTIPKIKRLLLKQAFRILQEDRLVCRRLGSFGARLIKNGDKILTICNAGALATADYGTALGVIYQARKENKNIKVFACETRPLLQGARLTTWELRNERIDTTLICDNMAADLMSRGQIHKVFVGADRIAANGDAANKIGTYNLAVLAKFHRVPFYVVAPVSSFDLDLNSGKDIPIEQRNSREVTHIGGRRIAPCGIKVYNPAFDVTPARLITAIITERGIIRSLYKKNIAKVIS